MQPIMATGDNEKRAQGAAADLGLNIDQINLHKTNMS